MRIIERVTIKNYFFLQIFGSINTNAIMEDGVCGRKNTVDTSLATRGHAFVEA